jgi:hypothetical protein
MRIVTHQCRPASHHIAIRSISSGQLKCDDTRAETWFRLSAKRRQFSRLLAAEVCAPALLMLDTPYFEMVWSVLATHSIRQFPLYSPPVRHRLPSHFNCSLTPAGTWTPFLPTGRIYAFLLILRLNTDYFPDMFIHWVIHPIVGVYYRQTQHTFDNIANFIHIIKMKWNCSLNTTNSLLTKMESSYVT